MLLQAQDSALLVVDVQEKLVPALNDASQTVAHIKWLLEAAKLAEVPVIFSEQYPQGLGATLPYLRQVCPESPLFSKTAFSCVAAGCLEGTGLPRQVVLCGIEAHVCVMQTALDLLAVGREVFVVADAVDSRSAEDRALALARLGAAGATIISREMALFEWLRDAKAPGFKEASRRLLQAEPRLSFAELITTLPRIDHLASLQLWRDGRLDSVIENKHGQQGSLAIYHALYRRFGAITPKAARLGQRLYGEHADDAHLHPGKHPNIDRLFALEAMGGGYGVRLIGH